MPARIALALAFCLGTCPAIAKERLRRVDLRGKKCRVVGDVDAVADDGWTVGRWLSSRDFADVTAKLQEAEELRRLSAADVALESTLIADRDAWRSEAKAQEDAVGLERERAIAAEALIAKMEAHRSTQRRHGSVMQALMLIGGVTIGVMASYAARWRQ